MITTAATRVPEHTDPQVNQQIRQRTEQNIAYYSTVARDRIPRRLRELEQEWDVERALETGASSLLLTGMVLGTLRHRGWFVLPVVAGGFFLQHALQGWCPPLPVFRRLGFRTRREIDEERMALKAVQGDFRNVHPDAPDVAQLLEAVRR